MARRRRDVLAMEGKRLAEFESGGAGVSAAPLLAIRSRLRGAGIGAGCLAVICAFDFAHCTEFLGLAHSRIAQSPCHGPRLKARGY